MHLHVDLQADDRLFWFTTTGWMMWNFVVGGLFTDASIVLYDGNPGTPDLGVLWDLAEAAGITCFGTSAAYIGACQKAGLRPAEGRDLSALRVRRLDGLAALARGLRLGVRGARRRHLAVLDLGRDGCRARRSSVVCPPCPSTGASSRRGRSASGSSPGAREGEPLIGEVGELVITEPMPSMPIYFWGDADGSRYRESYFEMFPGVWRHGDWIEITDRGTAIISGRSDATINRGGVRMGTSEIYRAVLAVDEVVDALVIDLPLPGTSGFMPLFVVLRPGVELDDGLVGRISGSHPRGLLAAARARRDRADRRGAADAVRQGARAPRQADPARRRSRDRCEPRLAREPGRARRRSRRWRSRRPTQRRRRGDAERRLRRRGASPAPRARRRAVATRPQS